MVGLSKFSMDAAIIFFFFSISLQSCFFFLFQNFSQEFSLFTIKDLENFSARIFPFFNIFSSISDPFAAADKRNLQILMKISLIFPSNNFEFAFFKVRNFQEFYRIHKSNSPYFCGYNKGGQINLKNKTPSKTPSAFSNFCRIF